jgi:cold shock CspA family protein
MTMDGVIGGTVKKIKRAEGFGFVVCDDGVERFFHRSSVKAGDFDRLIETKTRVRGTIMPGKPGKDERLEGMFISEK